MGFLAFSDVLSPSDWPTNINLPSLKDIGNGGLPRSGAQIARIAKQLEKGSVAIVAPPDRGKTFLSYQVGHSISSWYDTVVLFANCDDLTADEILAEIVKRRSAAKLLRTNHLTHLLILDDAHLVDPDALPRLIAACKYPQLSLLMTMRPQYLPDDDLLYKHGAQLSREEITIEDDFLLNVANEFISRRSSPPQPEEVINNAHRSWRDNVYSFVLAMLTWESSGFAQPLDKIDETQIISHVRHKYGLTDPISGRASVLHALAQCSRMSSNMSVSVINKMGLSEFGKEIADLNTQGLIVLVQTKHGPTYRLSDLKCGPWIGKAVEYYCPDSIISLGEIIAAYAELRPPMAWHLVKHGVDTSARDAIAQQLVKNEDFREGFRKSALAASGLALVRGLSSAYKILRAVDQKERMREIVPEEAVNRLIDELQSSPAALIRASVPILGCFERISEIFSVWTKDHWSRIVEKASLGEIARLTFTLNIYRAHRAVAQIAKAIAGINLKQSLASEGFSIQQLNNILKNFRNSSQTALQEGDVSIELGPIVESLSKVKIPNLAHDELKSIGSLIGHVTFDGSESTVSSFLRMNSQYLLDRIKVTNGTEAFYLVWHICVADRGYATQAAKLAGLERKWLADSSSENFLACVGLLAWCELAEPIRSELGDARSFVSKQIESSDVIVGVLSIFGACHCSSDRNWIDQAQAEFIISDIHDRIREMHNVRMRYMLSDIAADVLKRDRV